MQLTFWPSRVRTAVPWPTTFGLAIVLVLTTTASWWMRIEHGSAAVASETSAPVVESVSPLRFTVSANSSITFGDDGTTFGPDGIGSRLTGIKADRPVELLVDPRAPGVVIDELLLRLRDAGLRRCTLVVEQTKTFVDTLTPAGPDVVRDEKEAGR